MIVTPVADGVFFVQGPASNWTILSDGSTATLIDAGYPRDATRVTASVRDAVGELPIAHVLVTHGHADHIGSIPHLVETHGAEVWAAAEEIPNVTREVLHQIRVPQLLPRLRSPRWARWAVHAIRAGALAEMRIENVRALETGRVARFSGHRILPRMTASHTPGHLAFELPDHDAIATGDALVTAHPTVRRTGPQALEEVWHWDAAAAARVAEELALDRRVILPGHGPLLDRAAGGGFGQSGSRGRA